MELGCEHGRRPGQPCPHCLGISAANPRLDIEKDRGFVGMDPASGPDRNATVVRGAVAYEPHVLTVDKLEELAKKVKRQNMVYVVASDLIPDDAYGVLWVRKEDAEKWHELGARVEGVCQPK